MKTGRTLSDLAAELDRQAKSKKDYIADTRALTMRAVGEYPQDDVILDGVNGGMPLRDVAHGQIAATYNIPKQYYDRMRTERGGTELLAHNVNTWMRANPSKRLVRALDGKVRAFLSDSYRPLDNIDLAEAVMPTLAKLNANVMSCEVTESRFYLKAVTERVRGEVVRGDVVQAGIVISNSEVGQGSLRIEALDFRLVCLNGMISESAVRKAHLGRNGGRMHDAIEDAREYFKDSTRRADDKAFFLKVQDATEAMFDQTVFNNRLLRYTEAAEKKIEGDVATVVEVASRKLGITEGERGGVLQHLIRGGDLSAWGLANAITRTSADVDNYDRATELEALGGEVIELSPSEWKSIATAEPGKKAKSKKS